MRRRPSKWLLIRRALVRSRVKLRILFALLSLEEATLSDLAREARTASSRVTGALYGDGIEYRRTTSLVRLRLVRVEESIVGELVRLTPLGRRVAHAWQQEALRTTLRLRRDPHA